VPDGAHAGLRILGAEEDLARALLASLDDGQRSRAMIETSAPRDIVTTNSFGGNPLKLAAHGLEGQLYELNHAAARLAREAAPAGRYVAGSIGPTGKFLKPQGPCTEQDLESTFADQVRGLAAGGVDVLIVETQYDLREALAAVRGA
jgi:5-methyltetrahydrofolate--homocysteine methyltransferase